MGLLQTFARQAGSGREKPGPTRGDLVLTEDALPAELAGWTRTKFIPAPPVDELPEGQYWWVHQWQYQKDGITALVSFDQLGEDQWHELTYCYRGLDWTMKDRRIMSGIAGNEYFVVAEMRKENEEHGLLIFSAFFENGEWAPPPSVDIPQLNFRPEGAFGKTWERLDPIVKYAESTSTHTRALQCQVLVSSTKPIAESVVSSTIELHLQSRKHFRSQWLATSH